MRRRLPRFIGRLTYTFPKAQAPSSGEIVLNFYHLRDYFIVDSALKDFLVEHLSRDVEVAPVDMRHNDGTPASDGYFAVKVTRIIDCIAADKSLALVGYTSDSPKIRFADSMVSFELGEEIAADFANAAGNRYVAYPDFRKVSELHLDEARIPRGISMFQPAYWSGGLIVTADFAERLEQRCTGRASESFWALDQGDVQKEYNYLMRMLR
jgi:hypothetical protein